jgi:pimeloyl-ACP methyl ester carboxylesterase
VAYFEAGGVKLYYEDSGAGEVIVFVHEFAGDWRSWEPQVRHFARRYRCLTYNARGYPPSDVPEAAEAYSQAIATDDLAALLSNLSIDRAHVVGLSMGSFTALHFGLRHPRTAASLVVAGGGYGALAEGRAGFHADVEGLAAGYESKDVAAMAELVADNPFRQPFKRKDPRGWRESTAWLAEHSGAGSALTLRRVQKERPAFAELEAELAAMSLPVLVIVGDEDEPSLAPSLYLKRTIPGARLEVFPDSGHAVNLEEPERFNRALESFLSGLPAARRR